MCAIHDSPNGTDSVLLSRVAQVPVQVDEQDGFRADLLFADQRVAASITTVAATSRPLIVRRRDVGPRHIVAHR
jgi:hypothetical protein